ncbi:MAG: acylphosphatase [Parcubacteria group bacterium]|nr:acylphosphatase [Parcubacteria group bacterium]
MIKGGMTMERRRKALEIHVHGRVQGVAFRAYAQMVARENGLVGWIRNEIDGSVAAYIEGAPHQVRSFSEWCSSGPPASDITRVDIREVPPEGVYGDFSIY